MAFSSSSLVQSILVKLGLLLTRLLWEAGHRPLPGLHWPAPVRKLHASPFLLALRAMVTDLSNLATPSQDDYRFARARSADASTDATTKLLIELDYTIDASLSEHEYQFGANEPHRLWDSVPCDQVEWIWKDAIAHGA
jgi:hypothetical protein